MRRVLARLIDSTSAAVAPTVAMSLFGLIAAGGIAFDYARLASLDTELQQAADQAALAAATQLDRTEDAEDRATAAVQAVDPEDRLAANTTRFANDGDTDGTDITIADVTFCSDFDDGTEDTASACTPAEDPEDARFVIVTTEARTANYALTPVVAAFSGTISATAVAGIESSICNVAPLLVCVPDNDFPSDNDIGKGIILKPLDGVSGNYGLLDFGNGKPAVMSALKGFGLNGCQSTDDNETEPGTKATVTDAINTRMDVYDGGPDTKSPSVCNLATGSGCPAANVGKDVVIRYVEEFKNQTTVPTPTKSCPSTPVGQSPAVLFQAPSPQVSGFDRDNCHYTATGCAGSGLAKNIGDGVWDRAGYFARYHGGDASAALTFAGKASISQLTRFDVYRWELDNPNNLPVPPNLPGMRQSRTTVSTAPDRQGRRDYTITTQCTYSQPVYAAGAYPEQKDRRVLPIVAADCSDLKGKGAAYEDYKILRVFDIFLTEPSFDRFRGGVKVTEDKQIYGEIVGPAETVGGGNGFQYYSRSRPYLVR